MGRDQARLWPEPGDWRDRHPWAVTVATRLERAAAEDGAVLDTAWFIRTAERRGWSQATRDLYARAAQAAGHPVTGPGGPGVWAGPRSLPLLWHTGQRPGGAQLRGAAWSRLAAGWPAAVQTWHALDDDEVDLEGDDAFVRGRRVLGAGPAWRAWRDWRVGHLTEHDDGAALVTLRAANRAHLAGQRLSVRGMQDVFSRTAERAAAVARSLADQAHARRDLDAAREHRLAAASYDRLSYDTYRRLMLAAGAAPVDERGAVRAGHRRR